MLTPSLSVRLTDNPLLFQMQGLHTGKRQKKKRSEFKGCFEKTKAFHLSTTPPPKLSHWGFILNVLKPQELCIQRSFCLEGTWLGFLLCLGLQEGSRLTPPSMKTKEGLFSGQTQAATPELPRWCYSEIKYQALPSGPLQVTSSTWTHLDGENENMPLWCDSKSKVWKAGYQLGSVCK